MAKSTDRRVIYAVTQGCYSDYRVVGVFEDKALAEAYAAARNSPGSPHTMGDSAEVEEWPLITSMPKIVTSYLHSASVYLDGSVKEDKTWTNSGWDHEIDQWWTGEITNRRRPSVEYCRAPMHHGEGVRLTVRGWNFAAVEKVFGERLAMLKAEPAVILAMPEGSSAA